MISQKFKIKKHQKNRDSHFGSSQQTGKRLVYRIHNKEASSVEAGLTITALTARPWRSEGREIITGTWMEGIKTGQKTAENFAWGAKITLETLLWKATDHKAWRASRVLLYPDRTSVSYQQHYVKNVFSYKKAYGCRIGRYLRTESIIHLPDPQNWRTCEGWLEWENGKRGTGNLMIQIGHRAELKGQKANSQRKRAYTVSYQHLAMT